MLSTFRRFGWWRRKPPVRVVTPSVRLALERLEGRDLPAPLTPTGLAATGVSASALSLTWSAPPDPSITGYDVYEKVTHSAGGGKGSHGSYTTYNLIAANVPSTFDTITGLATGSSHDYLVKSVNATGLSPYSNDAVGRTWIAPTLSPVYVLLSNGTYWYIPTYGPVNATAGLTTQVTPYVSGNPLTFSILAGPPTASIDPKLGAITYTPDPSEVGAASITIEASNSLGNATVTIPFNVAAYPPQAMPTLTLSSSSSTYTGQSQQASATAVGSDGVTPVSGSFAFAYNGSPGGPINAGTYQVLATFTSADPNYGNATLVSTFTINQATPAFSNLSSPTVAAGTATTPLSGNLTVPYPGPALPTGTLVYVSINGVTQEARLGAFGNFSVSFPTAALPLGSYPITYTFGGNTNFSAAADSSTTLTVAAPAAPQVILNPSDYSTLDGTLATFTAAASGLPAPAVQWQVSTDGGTTFTNVTGATSPTLTFVAYEGMNRYHYRAVFTNPYGAATTTDAVLYVQSNDSGGGGGNDS
jgi:hypothetical protein